MLTRPELDFALARCEEIVHRRPTHLGHAASELEDPRRRDLFLASYASMRVADDLVDEEYLTLPRQERAAARARVESSLELWTRQSELAARNQFEPKDGSFEPELFLALSDQLGRSELGAEPWRRLACSLRRDLAERPVEDWEDFLDYCEGACIAPAAVFVYIVGARFDADGRSTFPRGSDPRELAHSLAIYSYLVHMRRDLLDDAKRSDQLVLLPREWMRLDGLSESEALALLRAGQVAPLRRALGRLADETERYRCLAAGSIECAERELGTRASQSLQSILRLYEETARREA